MKDMKSKSTDPVFIVGVPRSGTTVFSVKLDQATGIAMAPETHFMPEVYWPLRTLDLAEDANAIKAIDTFAATTWFNDLTLDAETLKDVFLAKTPRNWPLLFQTILQLFAENRGASLYGEKTPGHYRHVQTLLDWYPNCKIIFVMRDPRAVVASNMQAPFSPSYPWFIARRWVEMWDIYQAVSDNPRVSMVRYEDIVTDLSQVMTNVKQSLNINEHIDAGENIAIDAGKTSETGWRAQHLKKAAGAVNTASVNRWQSQLSPYEIWATDQNSGDGPKQCGYKPVKQTSSWQHQAAFFFIFPYQRFELAVRSAQLIKETGQLNISLKLRGLLAAGALVDTFSYFRFRVANLLPTDNGKSTKNERISHIELGRKHGQSSSFATLANNSEVLGLFVTALIECGHGVNIRVHSKNQYLTAKRLAHAFSIEKNLNISATKSAINSKNDSLEIFEVHLGNIAKKPVFSLHNIEIDATSAKSIARQIDKDCEQDSMQSSG